VDDYNSIGIMVLVLLVISLLQSIPIDAVHTNIEPHTTAAFIIPKVRHKHQPITLCLFANDNKRTKGIEKKNTPVSSKIRKSSKKQKKYTQPSTYIQFSRIYQRHVVYKRHNDNTNNNNKDEVIQSFLFLDDAINSYQSAQVLAPLDLPFPPPSCSLIYNTDENNTDTTTTSNQYSLISRGRYIDSNIEEEECETTIAGMGLYTLCELEYNSKDDDVILDEIKTDMANAALQKLLELVRSDNSLIMIPRHFFRLDVRRFAQRGLTADKIVQNYARVVDLLSRRREKEEDGIGLAMDPKEVAFVMQNFPQLCLYSCDELEGLIQFLLQPLPKSIPSVAMIADRGSDGSIVDWPVLAGQGHGVGLTIDQAKKAITMMPELLALYYEDSKKPSLNYLQQMQVSVPAELQVYNELNLEGTDPSDAFCFAFLHSLGIEWSQIRILQSSLPLWTTNNIEPDWIMLGKGPVRSTLKRPALDFLRQRLQISPSDVYRLLKTHTRLSSYDLCDNIMPKCDMLQSKLQLSSAELRKLVLRMPSLIGISFSAFNDRLDFFTNEVGMSLEDLKEAVLKQPSLLQYAINTTLQPKLDFFIDELGMDESSISRIIRLAPAVMGLSLTDNLRPKVVSLMKFGALQPHEIGDMVYTSPQELLLSRKNKIEPLLRFLFDELMLNEPRELGELIVKAPRILRQSLASIMTKIEMLSKSNALDSKEIAAAIIKNNPSLLTSSNTVVKDRIKRCPEDVDLETWLLPSKKGRAKIAQESHINSSNEEDPIIKSPSSDASLDSPLTKIYTDIEHAANDLDVSKSAARKAYKTRAPIGKNYLYSIADIQLTSPREDTHSSTKTKLSLFCSGNVYPSDKDDGSRGQRRTGAVSIQVFSDGSEPNFVQEFSVAAKSCFGIRPPRPSDKDRSKVVAVFPGLNPTKNRCELYAAQSSLMIVESFLRASKSTDDFYDINIISDSSYVWKLVSSKEKLLQIGGATSNEMLAHFNMPNHAIHIDILHPLIRSFCRLNGGDEPSRLKAFDNASVQFRHAMEEVPIGNGGLTYLRTLRREAKYAAQWQYHQETNLVS